MRKRPLWDNLRSFNSSLEIPWLLLGDFNNVREVEEKSNGIPITPYEVRDFNQCCYDIGISDFWSTGAFLTWTNNSVWSKLDRAMINNKWAQEGWMVMANFGFPGKFSDHSPCAVSLFEDNDQGVRPFKFFNIVGWSCWFYGVGRQTLEYECRGHCYVQTM